MNATITSIGINHPVREIRNSYFEAYLETSDQWIRERTGIERRFYVSEDEYTTDLCVKAVQSLATNYNKELDDIDFIIVATSTADQLIPNVASQIQTRLNIPNAGCFDLSSACSGFVYGLIVAKGLIAANTHRKVLVVGADTLSRVTDFSDRTTCILFGDGAGAVLVEATDENHVYKPVTATDGSYGKDLFMASGDAKVNGVDVIYDGNIHQNGRVVFKWAVTTLINKIQELASVNGLSLEDIDYLIPHSANLRILEAVCKGLEFPVDKCVESVRNYGNTSAASIPLAWHSGIESGRIKINDKLLLIGFGGGLTAAGICIDNNIAKVS